MRTVDEPPSKKKHAKAQGFGIGKDAAAAQAKLPKEDPPTIKRLGDLKLDLHLDRNRDIKRMAKANGETEHRDGRRNFNTGIGMTCRNFMDFFFFIGLIQFCCELGQLVGEYLARRMKTIWRVERKTRARCTWGDHVVMEERVTHGCRGTCVMTVT